MQHTPPPLFKQGASARVKVVFFTVLSIALLVIDSRLNSLVYVRQVVATALYPLQMIALMPRDALKEVGRYFESTAALQKEVDQLRLQRVTHAEAVQRSASLFNENAHLRQLMEMRERHATKSVIAEILYDARDDYTRKIILNKGQQHGVALSQPVIDERGVIGQVTRVFPLSSEVTLLSDKNQAIPVQVERNGMRSVIHGRGRSPYLDMRVTSNADIKLGDVLVTSGIDGIYPAGLQVAKVAQVENKATTTFEVVLCTPTAGLELHRQLMILLVETDKLAPPETEDARAKKEKINRRVTRDSIKDAPKDGIVPEVKTSEVVTPANSAATPAVTPAATKLATKSATKSATKPNTQGEKK